MTIVPHRFLIKWDILYMLTVFEVRFDRRQSQEYGTVSKLDSKKFPTIALSSVYAMTCIFQQPGVARSSSRNHSLPPRVISKLLVLFSINIAWQQHCFALILISIAQHCSASHMMRALVIVKFVLGSQMPKLLDHQHLRLSSTISMPFQ